MIIGETGEFHPTNEREVISLKNDSISQSEIRIPALPIYHRLRGLPMFLKNILLATKLPNGDFLLCGKPDSLLIYNSEKPEDYGWCGTGYYNRQLLSDNDMYFVLKKGTYEWTYFTQMKQEMHDHASVLVGGCIYSCGGTEQFGRGQTRKEQGWMKWMNEMIWGGRLKSDHLAFSLYGGHPQWKELKEMPDAVKGHASTKLNENQIMITGGEDANVSKIYQ